MADSVGVAEGVGGLALGTAAGLALAVQVLSLFVTADHWCWDSNVAALRAQLPLDAEDAKRFSLPRVDSVPRLPFSSAPNVDVTEFSRCERFDGDLVGAYVVWVAARRPPYRDERGSNRTTCDQGWEYNTTQGYHSLSAQMNWVCYSNWKVYAADAAFWIGGALGATVIAAIANRWGRAVAVLNSTLLAILGCGGSLVLTSSTALALVTRASLGLCFLPLLAAMDLLEDRRALTPVFVCIPSLLAPWLATYLGYWWYLTAVLLVVVAVAFCISSWFSFEEILKRLSRRHLVDASSNIAPDRCSLECPMVVDCSAESEADLTKESEMSYQHPLALEFVRYLCGLCYYGSIYGSVTLLGPHLDPKRQFASYCYAGLAELPAWFLYNVSSDIVFLVSLAGAAAVGIAHSIVPPEAFVLGVTLFLLHRLLIASAFHHLRRKSPTTRSPCSRLLQGMALAVLPCILFTGEHYSRLPSFLFGVAALIGFAVMLASGAVDSIVKIKRVPLPFDSMDRTQKQRQAALVISSLPYSPIDT